MLLMSKKVTLQFPLDTTLILRNMRIYVYVNKS